MHIAAAVGTPVVALFGPTGAYNWAPWEGIDWGYTAESPAGTRQVGRHIVVQKDRDCLRRGVEEGRRNAGMEEITLDEPIRQLGSYSVPVKLFKGVEGAVKVNVEKK